MRISQNFISHNDGDEVVLVSTGASDFSGLVHTNKTAGVIIEYLNQDLTEQELVNKMLERFDASRELIEKDVHKVISELRKIGALDE